ncbi:glycine zipper 2TM domain-containing protein [uncultured Sphingomonas sp.]|uniref:glycine zipper 2TM domain-containing protein n=1 Tax=uncultured Sphingomonas sp. TaxID=158754 RepID=UPI0030F6A4BF
MFRKMSVGLGSAALAIVALTPVAAQAQRWEQREYYERDDRGYDDDGYRDHDRAYRSAYRDGWNRGPRYAEYDRGGYDRGDDRYRSYDRDDRRYRYRARCQSGTTGTVLGAIAGGLLGRTIDRGGDRTLGTVIGAGAGALAGSAVERSDNPRYCQR